LIPDVNKNVIWGQRDT